MEVCVDSIESAVNACRGDGIGAHAGTSITESSNSEEKLWSDAATKQLIELYRQSYLQVKCGELKTVDIKQLTGTINLMCGTAFKYSQVADKIKKLKRSYRQVNKNTFGRKVKMCKFYDLLDEFLGQDNFARSYTDYTVTLSSDYDSCKGISDQTVKSSAPLVVIERNACTSTSVISDVQAASRRVRLGKRAHNEDEAVERRHKERMTRLDRMIENQERFLALMEKSLKKV